MRSKFMLAEMRKQTKALEVIAKSLQKLANPPMIAAPPVVGDADANWILPGGVQYVETPSKWFW